jgi:hypothetical protein
MCKHILIYYETKIENEHYVDTQNNGLDTFINIWGKSIIVFKIISLQIRDIQPSDQCVHYL